MRQPAVIFATKSAGHCKAASNIQQTRRHCGVLPVGVCPNFSHSKLHFFVILEYFEEVYEINGQNILSRWDIISLVASFSFFRCKKTKNKII